MSVRPDLALYTPHRQVRDAVLEGVTVAGLQGAYYHRADGSRVATVGVYHHDGIELFWAWGYADEAHCSWHAYRWPDGEWSAPRRGCPRVLFEPSSVYFRDLDLRLPTLELQASASS